jgi:predicted ABC-type ATPase
VSYLIVYAGPNGSGKSSLREQLGEKTEVTIDSDQIARRLNPMEPRAVDRKAGVEAIKLFRQTLGEGRSMSLESTLTGHTILKRMIEANGAGYQIGLRYVALRSPELNINRVRAGGHHIDPEVVRARVVSSFENLPRAIAIADRSVIYDNSGDRHIPVLDIVHGEIRQLAELPHWLAALRPRIEAELDDAIMRRQWIP